MFFGILKAVLFFIGYFLINSNDYSATRMGSKKSKKIDVSIIYYKMLAFYKINSKPLCLQLADFKLK